MKHLFCALIILFLSTASASAGGVYVFQDTHRAADVFVRAIKDGGVQVADVIHTRSLSADDVAAMVERKRADLVVAVGPRSLSKCRDIDTAVPLIYGLARYVELERPNASWVSVTIPAAEQIALIKSAMPHLTKLGVVHSDVAKRFVEEAMELNEIEIDTEVVEGPKESANAFLRITERLRGKNGAFWLVPDHKVPFPGLMQVIYQQSYTYGIAVVGLSTGYGSEGGILYVAVSPYKMGEQAAKLIFKALNGVVPQPVVARYRLRLNRFLASRMGVYTSTDDIALLEPENMDGWTVITEGGDG